MAQRVIVAVHGGAGPRHRRLVGDARAAAAQATIGAALRDAARILGHGGDALDAVVAAVRVLEDAPEFNAGRGSALTEAGTVEMCAAVADGRSSGFGAVAGVSRPRHPVEFARRVLLEGRHVLVAGPAADDLAAAWGIALETPAFFVTDRQRRALAERRPSGGGTVGAVARDRHGHLAAATSTGGISGKRRGRIGDTPVTGAGTWADDRTCAVSATGDGEAFLRVAFAHEVHARMRHRGDGLDAACRAALAGVAALGGTGGCVAVDHAGHLALPFTTAAMFRGWCVPGGPVHVGLDPGECEPP